MFAQGRNYGRSMVITQQGIAATSQTLASSAGAQILAKGGSAVDAAIAANAVLAVVEPMKTGLGGDLFVIYWEAKTGKLAGLNASGAAPKALSPEFLAKQGIQSMPAAGIHTFTVPGAVEGWAKIHQRYGKLAWKELFQSAIAYAEQGFPVTEAIQESWAARCRPSQALSRIPARFPAGRPRAQRGRRVQESRYRPCIAADRRSGRFGVLQGRDRGRDSEDLEQTRRHHDGGRSGRLFLGMGHADFDRLPGLEDLRAAAQQPRRRGARNVEYSGGHARVAVRTFQPR